MAIDTLVQDLAMRLRGRVLRPEDVGYQEARQLWNATIDKRPAVIARCMGAADVVEALRAARQNGLRVAGRGGGDNVAGLTLGGDFGWLSRKYGLAADFAFWARLRRGGQPLIALLGVLSLIAFALALTRVDSAFAGRAYDAYGGIYIVASLVWLWTVEGQIPTRADLLGAALAIVGHSSSGLQRAYGDAARPTGDHYGAIKRCRDCP